MSQKRPPCQLRAGAPVGDTAFCFATCLLHPPPAPRGIPRPHRVPGAVPGDARGVSPRRGSTHRAPSAAPSRGRCTTPTANKPAEAGPCPARRWEDPKQTTKSTGPKAKEHVQQRLLILGTAEKPRRRSGPRFGHPSPAAPAPQSQPQRRTQPPPSAPLPRLRAASSPAGKGFVSGYVPVGVFPQRGCRSPAAPLEQGCCGAACEECACE